MTPKITSIHEYNLYFTCQIELEQMLAFDGWIKPLSQLTTLTINKPQQVPDFHALLLSVRHTRSYTFTSAGELYNGTAKC